MANDSYDNLTKDMQPILQNLEDKVSNLSQKVKAFSGSDEAAVEDDLIEQIINYLRAKKASIAAIVDNATFQEALEQFEVAKKQYETAIETYKLKMCAQYGHYNITTVEQSVSTNEHTYYGNIHKFELVETCKYCGLKRRYTYTGTLGNIPGSRITSQEEQKMQETLAQLDEAYKRLLKEYDTLIKQFDFEQWFKTFLKRVEILPGWIEILEREESSSSNKEGNN